MEFWEFLIQKEGDRSWLPLESPSVEILAGRYRVVARSSRANVATEVRVTHYATVEDPPVRRIRKRSSHTNPEGLIVVLPFTHLQPGIWELRCTGDLMAEMMGENWRYGMQLEVMPVPEVSAAPAVTPDVPPAPLQPELLVTPAPVAPASAGEAMVENQFADQLIEPVQVVAVGEGEATPNLEPSLEPHPEPSPATHSDALIAQELAAALQEVEQHCAEVVSAAFQEFSTLEATEFAQDLREDWPTDGVAAAGLETAESQFPEPQFPESQFPESQFPEPLAKPLLQVILAQETYIIQRGEAVSLSGRISFLSDAERDESLRVSELRVRLYDPQTSDLLMDEVYPIDHRVPPFPFSGTVSLAEHYQTYLVLGELIFQGSTAGGALQVLATRSFNVTTDLHELIESIANDFPDLEALPPEAQIPEVSEPVPASELARLSALAPGIFQRSPQQPLPPQLRSPVPSLRTHAALDLPNFNKPKPQNVPTPPIEAQEVQEAHLTTAPASPIPELPPPPISTSAADLLLEPPLPSSDLSVDAAPQIPVQQAEETIPPPPEPDSFTEEPADLFLDWQDRPVPLWNRPKSSAPLSNKPEDVSFRALNWQDRFLSKLQSLAAHPEVSTTLGMEAAELPLDQNVALAPLSQVTEMATRKRQAASLDAELAIHEVVVDDEPLPAPLPDIARPTGSAEPPIPPADVLVPILPEDQPIPTPRLQLPSGELTAEQPIRLTVKLPNLQVRVYVKLWLRDRQTRELLGTPRWLIDFVPDGFGNQMVCTEVVVPAGCLKVQFEAIAVEISTQRESDKVTMTRPVVPPDLSPLSLDKLEI